ncbi:unnamed protein product [Mytilus edulis]|uniref:Uncharacterized protein n=1 Tax=Mytilus edulis TaxID=6550 RepID=A0A8S3VKG0_MYTED|nr:unnamed protein product [Mytilus edulis]
MSRCTSRLSDSERYDNDDEISKLFALDEEVDDSFSGFSQCENINDPELDNPEAQILIAEDIRMAVTQKQQQTEKENEPQDVASDDEFDYELPKSFEGDDKYVEEVSPSMSKVFDNICKNKSDVSVMTRDMKIRENCKSLVEPPVNAEIWQFLERKAKTANC